MLQLDQATTRAMLEWRPLIEALRAMFDDGCEMPVRHHHDVAVPGEADATLLLMPAWVPGRYIGVKLATVVPGNGARGLPAVMATYCLSSGRTGEMLALIDGGELTARRTAAASALAADYLARKDASDLLLIGTGRVVENLIGAHCAVRPIRKVSVWGRDMAKAEALAEAAAREHGVEAEAAGDLGKALETADIVSAATLSEIPLIEGVRLSPGCHVDLVGAFKPSMRESDDEAIRRASVFVDTLAGATREGGDIVQPLQSGVLKMEDIRGDLFSLATGTVPGRVSEDEITLFKSVGAALEDLAGAILAYETAMARPQGAG
ncbi:ornithine cyclodeaminase family protein [Stappia sp. F7233]|uniref:Ornithine cyclodeaminase family protein n=1 Tax=Stappia albiluteola TaxID=2758565 RepID=A0A839ALV1_9HYPH|nr:ornithine cyclodeaminase family protein [Stappia albiluteola]MBA5779409.1 ornithine cyclodeaminase family protein [Stappia albiluteola]